MKKEVKPLPNNTNPTLDDAKNQFEQVVVVGLKEDGSIDVVASLMQYPFLQWLLDRAKLELLLHERQSIMEKTTKNKTVH